MTTHQLVLMCGLALGVESVAVIGGAAIRYGRNKIGKGRMRSFVVSFAIWVARLFSIIGGLTFVMGVKLDPMSGRNMTLVTAVATLAFLLIAVVFGITIVEPQKERT